MIEFFQPDYFTIGIEVNVAQASAPDTWEAYKALHQFVYKALKTEYPIEFVVNWASIDFGKLLESILSKDALEIAAFWV